MLDDARIFHANINCSDLARSRAFYVECCGLAEGARTAPEETQDGAAFGLARARWDAWILLGERGFDGGAVDLLEWQEPAPAGRPPRTLSDAGFQRIGVRVRDLDVALGRAARNGGEAWGEPDAHALPDGGTVRIAFVSDPDGVAIELVEGGADGLSFVGVTCADLERSVAFYRALGFRELARFPSNRADGAHLRINGPVAMVEVLMGAPGRGAVHLMLVGFEQPPVEAGAPRAANTVGIWRTALVLPDVDAAVAGLRATGIEPMSDPQAMAMGPGLPDLRFVCFRGPDHEVIELIEQPPLA
jgi:catechol 2,3-dioxygenase-like lactoylglutathione lyase family enzyme